MVGSAPFANAGEESQAMIFNTADTLEKYCADDIDWPDWIDAKIQAINDGHGEFFAEVSNDSIGWQSAENLVLQDTTGVVKEELLDATLDGGHNVKRFKSVIRLLREKGLERLAVRYIPVDDDEVFIKLYYDAPSGNSTAVAPIQTDSADAGLIGPRTDIDQSKSGDSSTEVMTPDEESDSISVNDMEWQTDMNAGLMLYNNGDINLAIPAFKLGVTFKKEDRRWDLSLGVRSGGEDKLGKMAKIMVDGRHSWMFHNTQPNTMVSTEDEEDSDSGVVFGYHLGSFIASQFYTDVNEYSRLSYGLLIGLTCQPINDMTIFVSWAPALADKTKADLRGSFNSLMFTAQVEF